ncbi:MAG: hypothetical protein IPQ07_22430 [Myxococcales bacterium]|nr:hypothetical protein [Myxococcales bacterium]
MKASTGIGFAVVTAHAIGFVALATRCHGTELVVEVSAADVSPVLAIEGRTPPELADRVVTALDDDAPPGPGLHRKRWSVAYRGGFARSVGTAQLVGPFQDPAAEACTGRVVVAQRLLDDGTAGPGTLAGQMKTLLEAELAGENVFPIGDFTRIEGMSLRWARLEWHPEDRAAIGEAPDGYVRASAKILFDRVDIPIVIALIPARATTELGFRVVTRADLSFDNRVAQWFSDKLGGEKLATRLARRQIDGTLLTALAPPPPFELAGGGTLRFGYCGQPAEILEGTSGALPFSVELDTALRAPMVLPPKRGPALHGTLAPNAMLALDLDLDALNALLYELWRTGFLDRQLAEAGLDRRFNEDPIVQEFLTIRMSPVTLALPPVIAPSRGKLRMSADARVTITDGTTPTIGRVWGGLDFAFARTGVAATSVDLGALELSCERAPTTLVPCYADLVEAIRGRGADFHGALTDTFTRLLSELFVERHLGAPGLPAELVIKAAVPSVTAAAGNASLHLDLEAALVPSQ